MISRLAAALINLPRPNDEVSDLLWRNTDMNMLTTPRAIPSDRVVSEYAKLTEGATAESIASRLPAPSCISAAIAAGPSKRFIAGLMKNPALSTSQRIQLGMTEKHVDLTEIPNLAALESHLQKASISSIIELGEEATHAWYGFLASAAPLLADSLLVEAVSRNMRLDTLMAARLTSASTPTLETAVELLNTTRNPEYIATPAALRILRASGVIPAPRPANSTGLNAASIKALCLAGASDFEMTPLLLSNDSAELPEGFLVDILQNAPDHVIAPFLVGASARRPRPGEVLELLRRIGTERASALALLLTSGVETVPWVHELLIGLPVRTLDKVGVGGLYALEQILSERLKNPAAWEMVLVMSEEWGSTFDSLLDAANSMGELV
jgi:hypothetical protein